MSQSITKAVIAAAGYGTRMLPITKVISKEILPIVDKPILQIIVENLVAAGIEDIIIVTKVRKADMVDYFGEVDQGLADTLRNGSPEKQAILKELESIRELANFAFVEQRRAIGTGYPVLDAAPYIGDSPFLYLFADDFYLGEKNSYSQMIETYDKYHAPVFACQKRTADEDYEKYGYVGGDQLAEDTVDVKTIIEHPGKANKPGDLASVDGFVATPEVIGYLHKLLENLESGRELYFHGALKLMIEDGKQVVAKEITGADYYDTGNKLEYMKTSVALAAKHPEIGDEFRQFLSEFVQKEQ
jgi:UTP--glucose-1-phosphate uridylyltransferase